LGYGAKPFCLVNEDTAIKWFGDAGQLLVLPNPFDKRGLFEAMKPVVSGIE